MGRGELGHPDMPYDGFVLCTTSKIKWISSLVVYFKLYGKALYQNRCVIMPMWLIKGCIKMSVAGKGIFLEVNSGILIRRTSVQDSKNRCSTLL